MTDEYVDPEFPEMESPDSVDWDTIPDESEGDSDGDVVYPQEDQELLREQVIEVPEYLQQESFEILNQDSEGDLFLPDDDPIQQPLISDPLDSRLVYTRQVSRRLRHLVCERRGAEYQKPAGLYRPGN